MILLRTAVFVFIAAFAVSCGGVNQSPGPEARVAARNLAEQAGAAESAAQSRFQLFAKVFDQVRTMYVDEVDDAKLLTAAANGMRKAFPEPSQAEEEKLVTAAIDGMLGSLDPYSAYLDNRNYKAVRDQTRGEFGGIGLQVTKEGDAIKVISPIDGTPAAKAGVVAGDAITHADGKSLSGLTLRAAVLLLRGPAGSAVRLTVKRNDETPFEVAIVRARIHVKAVRWVRENNIGYLRISSFTAKATREFVQAFEALRKDSKSDLTGLVIDLRNNPGGLLEQSVLISDALLEGGEIVSTRGRTEQRYFKAHAGDIATGLPIVVLVNGGSASAAEILAGALKDHGRAILVGGRTFGKGSVQTIIPFSQRDGLKLTTARYYTPSGKSVDGGIEPDIAVAQDPDREGDEQRERAVEELSRLSAAR
ncbi:MAG: PDZ domain-containing protein [Alphaproteobacteria bacterium]|nr:PDZ domain-containing protein [Alphaproteobacteria bacterium]